jgi:pyruvate dehydrogenase E2 component (dihydrolipoamide acetyltransferase)
MAKEFKLPPLGENIEQGDVVSVLVKVGDEIAEGQAVLELETDKATVEVPSEVSGKIEQINVSDGDTVEVGQLILTVTAKASSKGAESDMANEAEQPRGPEIERAEEPAPQVEKVEELPAQAEGEPAGDVVDFRQRETGKPSPGGIRAVAASPAVRRFAREVGVDVSKVSGSGPKGRISVEDVKNFLKNAQVQPAPPRTGATPALPDFSRFGEISREPFSNVRRATAEHLSAAWANVAHVTNHDSADVTRLEGLRKRFSETAEVAGGKLTVTAIALKIAAAALKKFPKFNAAIDVASQEIIFKSYFNIGVAVDTERGLLVPVVRDVDQKSIVQLSVELKELAEKARSGKISLDDLQGGCFTITNLGGIGGTNFTPIVNYPEVAILGLSRSSIQPVFVDGEFEPRRILPLSLSYDHRLIDGADAARFLRWVANAFEEPFLLALDG